MIASPRKSLRRQAIVWGVVALTLAAIVVWAAVQDSDPLSAYVPVDKVRHILAFGALGLCAAFMPSPIWRIRALGLVAAFALLVEVIQIPVPDRNASLSDLAASLVGAFAGYGFGSAAATFTGLVRGRLRARQSAMAAAPRRP
jgi:VanZ family protein